MAIDIQGFLITAPHEVERQQNVAALLKQFPQIAILPAVYPSQTRVPFLSAIKKVSRERTGISLLDGEVGCLLSHRNAWRQISQKKDAENAMYLVLESDSQVHSIEMIHQNWDSIASQFDIFFWGAWEGNMKLFRSTKKKIGNGYAIGIPFMKSVYCTYGYSLNAKAADLLLNRTNSFNHPVDQFKYFNLEESIKIGGVMPELISNIKGANSYIRKGRHKFKEFIFGIVLNLRNNLICYFK